mgnify:CR=1 FL=1
MKVFIDAGANIGQSVKSFTDNFPDAKEYKIFSFEPASTERIKSRLKKVINKRKKQGYNIEYHKKAVWIYDGEVTFYEQDNEGSTTEKTKNNITSKTRKTKEKKVECIDLAKFIDDLPDDAYIILKLDIEGGEYKVIDHLDKQGALKKVSEVFIELHACKIKSCTIEDDYALLETLAKHNLSPVRWEGKSNKVDRSRTYTKDIILHDWSRYKRIKKK